VSNHVTDGGGDTSRTPGEPEPVWRRPAVDKPAAMPDALWEATRTEMMGADAFQRISPSFDYDRYQACDLVYTYLTSLDVCT